VGIINFFKKIFEKEEIVEVKPPEKISFESIGIWISNKREEIEIKEKQLLILIKNKIIDVNGELEGKLVMLENIDFSKKRGEERVKALVKEGLDKYVESARELMENLIGIEESNFRKFILRIKQIFLEFDRKSFVSYQKANFLIGKEMVAARDSIVGLSKFIEDLFQKNKDLADASKSMNLIKLKSDQINELDKTLASFNLRIDGFNQKINNREEQTKKILEEISKIKESPGYLENLNKQKGVDEIKRELAREIYQLKEMIDFKALANIFYVNKKQMDLIKAHKENFQNSFEKDNGETILKFLDEAKINSDSIKNKVKQINETREKIIIGNKEIKKDETLDLDIDLSKIKFEIESLVNEKEQEERAHEKLNLTKAENLNLIEKEFIELNVEFI